MEDAPLEVLKNRLNKGLVSLEFVLGEKEKILA